MAQGKAEIETIDAEDERNGKWFTTAQVVAKTGWSRQTIENMVRRKELHYVYNESKERLFNPESLVQDESSATDSAIHAEVVTTTMALLKGMNRDLQKGYIELIKLGTERELRDALMAENRALRDELDKSRERYAKSVEAFEQALTMAHERELERLRAQNRENRMNQTLEKSLEQLPSIVAALSQSFGVKREVERFVNSLTVEQKALLFEAMTDEQRELLLRVMNGSSPKEQNGAGTPGKGTEHPAKGDSVS